LPNSEDPAGVPPNKELVPTPGVDVPPKSEDPGAGAAPKSEPPAAGVGAGAPPNNEGVELVPPKKDGVDAGAGAPNREVPAAGAGVPKRDGVGFELAGFGAENIVQMGAGTCELQALTLKGCVHCARCCYQTASRSDSQKIGAQLRG